MNQRNLQGSEPPSANVISAVIDVASGNVARNEYSNLAVERDIELGQRVRYRTTGFRLEIRTDSFNSVLGTMSSEFRYSLNGFDTRLDLNCRMGGELDIQSPVRIF